MTEEQVPLLKDDPKWIDGAKELDVCHHSKVPAFQELTEKVFDDVNSIAFINNRNRSKYTLKTILLNLWISYLSDRPIMYSRNAIKYNHSKRYGKLHFKYRRVIKLMDTLKELNYLEQRIGYFNREDGVKRRTRIYPNKPLCELFNHYLELGYDVVYREAPRELIQLRNAEKEEIDYKESTGTTKQRIKLYNYNKLISEQDLFVNIPCDAPIKAGFIEDLNLYLSAGFISAEHACGGIKAVLNSKDNLTKPISEVYIEYNRKDNLKRIDNNSNNSNVHDINRYISDKYNKLYSYICTITSKVLVKNNSFTDPADNKVKIVLKDLGITKLVLRINYSSLHRVYNNGSFDLGGRFYGAFHLGMPKELRPFIVLNGNRTVELDYSALHIRMLYHLEGKDYRDDPYISLCNSPEDRRLFKFVQLIAVNAGNEQKAVQAMRQVIRQNGLSLCIKSNDLYPLFEKFKTAHKPIAKYLASGVGRTLQNIDSKITEYVLMTLKDRGIPALPVHDSYMVDEKYEGILAETMNEGYEKLMGYQPVIG